MIFVVKTFNVKNSWNNYWTPQLRFQLCQCRFSTTTKHHLAFYKSISPTCWRPAFMPPDSKNVKIQFSHQFFFALLGSERIKGARKMLMKLTLRLWALQGWRGKHNVIFGPKKNISEPTNWKSLTPTIFTLATPPWR